MDIIKRKISIESLTSRVGDSTYGTITADTINIKILLTQTIDNIGIMSDIDVSDSVNSIDDFYAFGGIITAYTKSNISSLKTYNRSTPYNTNIINNSEIYLDYKGDSINGVSKVLDLSGTTAYTFNANNDVYIGTDEQSTGILYEDYGNITTAKYKAEGWNETNISFSGIVKDDMLLGIVSPPEVYSDVLIDRGKTTVFESHLRLSEIENLDHLVLYGNGYYNIING